MRSTEILKKKKKIEENIKKNLIFIGFRLRNQQYHTYTIEIEYIFFSKTNFYHYHLQNIFFFYM